MAKFKKVGDVVCWVVVNCDGEIAIGDLPSRELARKYAKKYNEIWLYKPYRIAKVFLAK